MVAVVFHCTTEFIDSPWISDIFLLCRIDCCAFFGIRVRPHLNVTGESQISICSLYNGIDGLSRIDIILLCRIDCCGNIGIYR